MVFSANILYKISSHDKFILLLKHPYLLSIRAREHFHCLARPHRLSSQLLKLLFLAATVIPRHPLSLRFKIIPHLLLLLQ